MGNPLRWLSALFGKKKTSSAEVKPLPKGKSKKWGSLMKSFREKDKNAPPFNSYCGSDDFDNQNKRATAVAVASAAVAEAAIAAAQAAAAAVKLTNSGRMTGGGIKEEFAAIKIQSAFRGYLARRALRALKGLVKLQALVRGNIVRKQAAEAFRCMQALVRVQARARACRAIRSDIIQRKLSSPSDSGPSTPEKFEIPCRGNGRKTERSSTLKSNSSRQPSTSVRFDQSREQKWLDQWIEDRYSAKTTPDYHPQTLDLHPEKPLHPQKSKRQISYPNNTSPLTSDQTQSYTTVPSPPSVSFEGSSLLDLNLLESSRRGLSPAKSECSRSLLSEFSDCPSYMSYTESSRAKVRSQSVPKQRPEFEKSGSLRRQLGNRSFMIRAKFESRGYYGSARLDRIEA